MFFFFKQKTAYGVRISDWSSDVCSSDLVHHEAAPVGAADARESGLQGDCLHLVHGAFVQDAVGVAELAAAGGFDQGTGCRLGVVAHGVAPVSDCGCGGRFPGHRCGPLGGCGRSEEHTSELQSLMRISYAVFCLKKKNTNTNKW